MKSMTPLGAVVRGFTAAGAGTLAMDLQQYAAYRLGGGTSGFLVWEFGGIDNWEEASIPGQVGKRLAEAWTQSEIPPKWAGLMSNIMHWSFGVQWGGLLGIVGSNRQISTAFLGPGYGTFVWLVSYAILPLGHFYEPIWKYDARTLGKDLFSHLIYGTTSGVVFRLLAPREER
ncbi:MAG: hypothetical protein NVSMB52_19090 [Chloroflexota bacterium]